MRRIDVMYNAILKIIIQYTYFLSFYAGSSGNKNIQNRLFQNLNV